MREEAGMTFEEIKSLAQTIRDLQNMTDDEFADWLKNERKECVETMGKDIWPEGNSDDVRGYVMLCHYQSLVDEVVECQI